MPRFSQIVRSTPAEYRGLSIPAFVVRFPIFLEDLYAKKQVRLSTKAVGSLRLSGLPKMQHYFVKPSAIAATLFSM